MTFSNAVIASASLLFGLFQVPGAWAYNQPRPTDYNELNLEAGSRVLYELQVRSANACETDLGSDWQRKACAQKISPPNVYRAEGQHCGMIGDLNKIKLGTLDDLLEDTTDYHAGITLKYIKEKVGANTVWIMPIFPDNDRWNIPDACDNLGSPYAVRDYMHVSGALDRACIQMGLDENSAENGGNQVCWGNYALDKVIAKAHELGLKVMLDVAMNHFGHNYRFYDYAGFTPTRERIARGQDLDALWDYASTFEQSLLQPSVLDTMGGIQGEAARNPNVAQALRQVQAKCPKLSGDLLVRAVGMWREMLDWERAQFKCDAPVYLEYAAPGFYAGSQNGGDPHPSSGIGDNFTNNWQDVKFIYHHEYHGGDGSRDFYQAFVRNREYLFRVLNLWVSRGVDGFRLDHTTDPDSGMGPNEWKYLIGKVDYYDWVRKGQPSNWDRPIFLAEEFGDQMGMNHVVDVMTDGYVGDIRGGGGVTKDTSFVERALDNGNRFGGHAFVMRALETHDEPRLFENTGFDIWTGAGFWGIGATSRGTPMLLMGQEFGESWGLGFRRSALLPSRFYGHPNHIDQGQSLVEFYHDMAVARTNWTNTALVSDRYAYLRTRSTGAADPRIFAQVKWSQDGNVVFVFHNLWYTSEEWVEQSYFIPPGLASQLSIQDGLKYKLVDALSDKPQGDCHTGADLKWNLYVKMNRTERLQWLRLELCQ